ncbi:hypothetical protein HF847_04250 [Clostridium cochlearium]|uniref:hypothetical protein n=1 Tax=Clostridium cochlearium TaxID=1494 RepID=UPI000BBC05C0|nr:hypothetical protein [Clostridium cochlearium]MBE6063837.1 hypothetical protein [Clostridium cochlearium]MCR1971885.1 hypothetical protein [Clostridium cochlearium]NME95212.1 hypothetical protein [Clostridium cochlearium]
MSISEAILIGLFLMLIVFAVLILLSIILKLQSKFFNYIEKNKFLNKTDLVNDNNCINLLADKNTFGNIDEETIAIILASISHTSNIPLKSLKIKSIKPIDL